MIKIRKSLKIKSRGKLLLSFKLRNVPVLAADHADVKRSVKHYSKVSHLEGEFQNLVGLAEQLTKINL